MYDYEEFDDMVKRDKNMTLYSQSNVIASYISMIKFAIEKIELYVDEIGDEVFFDGDTSPFPPDVLGDDSLFDGYTNPWSPDDEPDGPDEFGAFYNQPWDTECHCAGELHSRCDKENKINPARMSVGNIMDMLYKTRKAPQDYRMD